MSGPHPLPLLDKKGYDVVRELGKGQFGKVLLVRNRDTGEEVGAKLLAESISSENERNMIGLSSHPNVLRIFDCFYDPTLSIYVCLLEYCNGGDLEQWLMANDRPLNFRETVIFTTQAARGIQFLHANSIAHRDIKPSNVLLHIGADGWTVYKLGDFGTARDKDMMETLAGTPFYMAGEIEDGAYDKTVDLWSFGCTIYYCCTLRQLFQAATRAELREQTRKPVTPARLSERLAAETRCTLDQIERERLAFSVSALVQINPTQRMDIADLLQQLQPTLLVTDVRTGDHRPVPLDLAKRPTVANVVETVAAVFELAPENLHLMLRSGELTDERLSADLLKLPESLLLDAEAFLGNAASDAPEDNGFEFVEDQSADGCELPLLAAKAQRTLKRLRARLPELEATASMRDVVARQLAAGASTMASLRVAKDLLASIGGVSEDETLAAVVQLEKSLAPAAAVLAEADAFFDASQSPLVELAKQVMVVDLPSGLAVHELPSTLHKHLTAAAANVDRWSTAQRQTLCTLLRAHASLVNIAAPSGALTRADRALARLRDLMRGIVERTGRAHAAQQLDASVAAAVSSQLAAAQADGAAKLAQARAEHAVIAAALDARHEQLSAALQQAQGALAAREQEVGLAADPARDFGARLSDVLTAFYQRSLEEAAVTAAVAARAGARRAEQLEGALAAAQAEVATLQDQVELVRRDHGAMAADMAAGQQVACQLRARVATLEQQVGCEKARTADCTRQLDALNAHALAQEGEFTRNLGEKQSLVMAMEAQNTALKQQIAALQDEHTRLVAEGESNKAAIQQRDATSAALTAELASTQHQLTQHATALETHAHAQMAAAAAAATASMQAQEQMRALAAARDAAETELETMRMALRDMAASREEAVARVDRLENAMRTNAEQTNQIIMAKDSQIRALQPKVGYSPSATSSLSYPTNTPIPQFTPPPIPAPASPAAAAPAGAMPTRVEVEALRAENTNLKATVRKLSDGSKRLAEVEAALAAERTECDRLRQMMYEKQVQLEHAADTDTALVAHLQVETAELERALGAARATVEDEQRRGRHAQQEIAMLREHVERQAGEMTRLQEGAAEAHELAGTVVDTAQFLFGHGLQSLEACSAKLRAMLDRRGELVLLALANIQHGDPILTMSSRGVLQRAGRPLHLDHDVAPGTVCTVVFVEGDTVLVDESM